MDELTEPEKEFLEELEMRVGYQPLLKYIEYSLDRNVEMADTHEDPDAERMYKFLLGKVKHLIGIFYQNQMP